MTKTHNSSIDHARVKEIIALGDTSRSVWDYAACLGNSDKEKNDSLLILIEEIVVQVRRRSAMLPADWIVMGPEITDVFVLRKR